MRSNIRNISFVIGIVLSCAYHTLALVALRLTTQGSHPGGGKRGLLQEKKSLEKRPSQ
jgi:hypothetical protein